MKIAIYSGVSPSTTFIERLIFGLSESNSQILLVGRRNEELKYNSNVVNATYKNLFTQLFFILKYYLTLSIEHKKLIGTQIKLQSSLREKLKKLSEISPVLWHKPDIFHIQWAKSVEEWIFLKKTGIKIVLSLRGAHINYSPIIDNNLGNMYKKIFPMLDGFHGVSQAIIDEADKYNLNTPNAKVIYSGLNLKNLTYSFKEFNSVHINFISIGRPHWIKGYSLLLDVMALFKRVNDHFQLKIVGGFNEEILFQRHQLHLANEVEFIDNLPFNLVKENIKKSDFLILPSYEEGIANVVLEAMALGIVVVASDCGGMSEVISDGHNGFLFKNRSREDLLNKLLQVSKLTSKEYETIAVNARRIIEENHTEEKMVEGMIKLYNQVLAN